MSRDLTRAVLVIIDVQHGFVRPASMHVVPGIQDLASRWSHAGGAVVLTRYLNHAGSAFERLIGWSGMMPGTPDVELVPELTDAAKTAVAVVEKHTYSSLTEEVRNLIAEHGWTDLYLCGIATESCVLKTAVDAFEDALTPWIITDLSASHAGEETHQAGLLVASRFIGRGQLITAADVSARLLRQSA